MERIQAGIGEVSEEEVEREIEEAIAEVRREQRLARRIVDAIRQESPDAFGMSDEHLQQTIAKALAEPVTPRVAAESSSGHRT